MDNAEVPEYQEYNNYWEDFKLRESAIDTIAIVIGFNYNDLSEEKEKLTPNLQKIDELIEKRDRLYNERNRICFGDKELMQSIRDEYVPLIRQRYAIDKSERKMDTSYKLSEKRHESIFQELKESMLKASALSSDRTIVILGGQPGSGKTRLIEIAKATILSGRQPAIINGDDYREVHPLAQEIKITDEKKYAELTDCDVRDWTKRLFDAAIENSRDIIFEGTMRNKEPIMKTIQNLKDAGYKVHIMVRAVNGEVSRAGTVLRYEVQKAEKGYGRWVAPESHDEAYQNMPDTVRAIENESPIESVSVCNGEYQEIYRNESKEGVLTRPARLADVAAAISEERERPLANGLKGWLSFKPYPPPHAVPSRDRH